MIFIIVNYISAAAVVSLYLQIYLNMLEFIDQFPGFKYLDHAQKDFLMGKIQTRKVKKGEVLQEKGSLALKAFYVKEGLLRSYSIDEKGKEHIYMFGPEKWIVSDMAMLVNESQGELFVDAIENSIVEVIDSNFMKAMDEIAVQHPEIKTLDNMRLARRVSVLQKRVIMLMSASAKDRYEHFLETYPGIVQRVPQKMIASYLGITPEALSKIRGDIARK